MGEETVCRPAEASPRDVFALTASLRRTEPSHTPLCLLAFLAAERARSPAQRRRAGCIGSLGILPSEEGAGRQAHPAGMSAAYLSCLSMTAKQDRLRWDARCPSLPFHSSSLFLCTCLNLVALSDQLNSAMSPVRGEGSAVCVAPRVSPE